MVGGSIVVLFKWCSIVIALYIMRTFSPNSGSVFCGLLVCLLFSCCVFCFQINETYCFFLNCLVFCCVFFVFDKLSLIWFGCHFGVCPVVFIICLSCRCEDLSVLWWTCGKMSIMWWTGSCHTNTVVPDCDVLR